MKDVYTYRIGDNLYVNLTNRCSNNCTFCVRNGKSEYEGYPLWLKNGEPTAEQVLAEIPDPAAYREIVFCGFGEPTERLDALLEAGRLTQEEYDSITGVNAGGRKDA